MSAQMPARQDVARFRSSGFLESLRIDHGPVHILGRFFLRADTAARERGIELSFGSFADLAAANEANRSNWRPLIGVFDPRNGRLSTEEAFCVLGRNQQGEVVAAHAARLYHWPKTSFCEEARSLRLFYADPDAMKQPGEHCLVTAAATQRVRGCVVFSGAAWYRPDYRGRGLSAILPRVGKAYAFARWNPDYIVSMMAEDVYGRGFAPRFGYPNVDWDIRMLASPLGDLRLAFLWMDGGDLLAYVERFLGPDALLQKTRAGANSVRPSLRRSVGGVRGHGSRM